MTSPVALSTGAMYAPPCPVASVVKEVQNTLVGQIGSDSARLVGQVSIPGRVVGMIRNCPGGDDVTDLSFCRGDSADFPFVVLDDPDTLLGTWTWDGTLMVTSTDTSGVVDGDWIRLDENNPWFKITAITPNVNVTIENPDGLTVPSGSGASGASPIDLTDSVVRATARQGDRVAFQGLSYDDPDGVEITDAAAGEGIWHITPHDQEDDRADEYLWDIETNRRGTLRSNSGTMTPTAGGTAMTFSDATVVAGAQVGDIFVGVGAANAENQLNVLVTATPDCDDELDSDQLRTDYDGWVAEAAFTFELYRVIRKTPDGLKGTLTLVQDSTP